eukprot:TRINITY_DN8795_c0_g1_i1.p1 TRINITY_DN8795_c0_g1~~TRINITY_DN8795_c0_g1_i1.p1  ORF type:complete len:384 (+),score=46.74 TRINITY_DN8795_c0_g1_i1:56-1153(+)
MAAGATLALILLFVAAHWHQPAAMVLNTSAYWKHRFNANRASRHSRAVRRHRHRRHLNWMRAQAHSLPMGSYTAKHLARFGFGSRSRRLRLDVARPLKWLHIPKCGTSFVNTLVHHKGICPGLDPNMLFVNDRVIPSVQTILDEHPGMYAVSLNARHDWVRSCSKGLLGARIMSHYGIQDEYDHVRGGHGATMMRQPEQRAISGYLDHHNFCGPDVCSIAGGPREYAERTSGCAVKLLTRGGLPCFMNQKEARVEISDSEVMEARRRLRDDFAFVGIAEEWDLSVCLFHAMFGGTCYEFEMANVHPSTPGKKAEGFHNVSILNGYTDPYDTPVYEEAKKLFFANIAKYEITRDACRQTCSQKLHS